MKSVTVGNITIYPIHELDCGKLIQSIIPKAIREEINKIDWLQPNYADKNGNLKATVLGFLIVSRNHSILVDTGNGNDKKRTNIPEWSYLKTKFLENLRATGVKEEDVDFVINTHMHCDHVGWNTKLVDDKWIPTFPNSKYIFVEKEYSYWETKPIGEIADDHAAFQDSVIPIIEAGNFKLVSPDHQVAPEVSLIPTFGHTPGHVCVQVESKGEKAIITGDLLYHPCQIKHLDWTAESDGNPKMTIESRKRILNNIANTDTLLLAPHFPEPVSGKVVGKEANYKLHNG